MPDSRIIAEGLKRGKVDRQKGEIEYLRFREGFRGIERGTVIADGAGRVVWGYPHIPRIFSLEKGIGRNITAKSICAEEKIDGFNVRIASIKGKVCAFSRGGFLDMFATEKARELGFERFFKANPEQVLCGEMIGNTPHTAPTDGYDVKLFIFDIDEGDGKYLPCDEKHALLKKFGIEGVPVLGRFRSDDFSGLKKLAIAINKGRKEGMVLKSGDRKEIVKFVTPWSDIEDIERTSGIMYDMPIGFYYQRVLRSAFFINDFALDHDEYAKKLGNAFYGALIRAIKDAHEGRGVADEFEISFKDPAVWDDIRKHMGKEVKVEEIWRKREGGRTRLRFRKFYKKTSRMLISLASGKGVTD
jgi:putative ATP-dependent DNA ligase